MKFPPSLPSRPICTDTRLQAEDKLFTTTCLKCLHPQIFQLYSGISVLMCNVFFHQKQIYINPYAAWVKLFTTQQMLYTCSPWTTHAQFACGVHSDRIAGNATTQIIDRNCKEPFFSSEVCSLRLETSHWVVCCRCCRAVTGKTTRSRRIWCKSMFSALVVAHTPICVCVCLHQQSQARLSNFMLFQFPLGLLSTEEQPRN